MMTYLHLTPRSVHFHISPTTQGGMVVVGAVATTTPCGAVSLYTTEHTLCGYERG